ncbi:hypothetical protein GGS23DRAFT_550960 [Durotheca rogersii]|uniref:uncharacterized protein n=1 Tax=Durotheca rogersii TaxID=419775 RepID=UPI002220FAB2|nr:uncharacterized protein GGS23DRAFT_550960 [Durotheca rogersii]KAI5866521.1 hypothetical protein GGS23DRAFT_550960 [Durotheca rogersii]
MGRSCEDLFSKLPTDVLAYLVDRELRSNPRDLINLVLAHPRVFLSGTFNVATLDATRQIRLRDLPSPETRDTIPLINTAIEMGAVVPWWLIRLLGLELERAQPGTLNGIYPSLRPIEPPLHTAVRCGQADIVRSLLQWDKVNAWVKYCPTRNSSAQPSSCKYRFSAHLPPCTPNSPLSDCKTAVEYAISEHRMAMWGFRMGPIRSNIEHCALAFVELGHTEQMMQQGHDWATNICIRAVFAGMNRYFAAVLDRVFELPPENAHRRWLHDQGLRSILYRIADLVRDDSSAIQHIVDKSIETGAVLFPGCSEQELSPILTALGDRKVLNAIYLLRLADSAGIEDRVAFMMSTLDGAPLESMQDDYEFAGYRLAQYKAVKKLLDGLAPGSLKRLLEEGWGRYVRRVFSLNQASKEVTKFLVRNGHNSPEWMQEAIAEGSEVALSEIIKIWGEQGIRIDTPFAEDPRNVTGTLHGKVLGKVSALQFAIRGRKLWAILMLMDAHADESLVDRIDWYLLKKHLDFLQHTPFRHQLGYGPPTYLFGERCEVEDKIEMLRRIAQSHR